MSLKVQKIQVGIFMLMSCIQRTVTDPISLELHVCNLLQNAIRQKYQHERSSRNMWNGFISNGGDDLTLLMEAQDVGYLYVESFKEEGETQMKFCHILSNDILIIPAGLVIDTTIKNEIRAKIANQAKKVNIRTQEAKDIIDDIAANNWTLSDFGREYVTRFNTEDSEVDGQLVSGNHLIQYAKDANIWGPE